MFQTIACATQSLFGDVLVSRGAFALYRAEMIREIVDSYTGETFLGHPVKLGDDAALTLFARGRGRAVQQSSAFALTMYPETLWHHLRQWCRWMRGSTILQLLADALPVTAIVGLLVHVPQYPGVPGHPC